VSPVLPSAEGTLGIRGAGWLVAFDAVAVLVFAAIGRRSHAEVGAIVGVVQTAAPFLLGAVAGVLASRSWRDPPAWRSGVATWVGAVVVGLALRALVLDRLPLSFAVVATVSLGVLILGWRGVVRGVVATGRRRSRARA